MTEKEKFSILASKLRQDHYSIETMSDDQLTDYVELMYSFVKTDDPILAESAISTMSLIVKNTIDSKVTEQIAKNSMPILADPLIAEITGVDLEKVHELRQEYLKTMKK